MSESAIETLPATIQNISVDEKDKEVVKSDEVREAKSEVSTQSAVTPVQCPPHVPQHLMGVDVNGTSTEVTGTGKRIPKPRLGVKVPYRNLTSQIVTQDEIAQEILERSLKKYPYQKFENSDLLFTMKLTNHFQNRIPSPSTAVAATSQTLHAELTHEEEEEDNRIKDNKELLAILDGSPEISSDKANVGKKNIRQEGKGLSPSPYKFIKMYPELEKELALKQLEEFTKPRKKKPETGTDVNKQNGKSKLLKRVKNEMENNNNIEKKTETCLNVMAKGKPGRKRKIATPPDSPKRKRVLKSTNGDTHQPTASTVADVSQITELPTVEDGTLPTVPPVKDSKSIKKYINRRLASRSDEDPDSLENADALNGSLSGDNEPDSYRIESSSPKMKKTVSPKKSDNANVNNINKQKVSDIQENNSQNTTTPMGRKKQTRVMREIDRLLGDEGAINMLYSVEQKRTPGNTPNRRGILPSARRKKKDLLLKTRLVKNAVLRLSNSPTQSSAKTALRVRRHSNPTEILDESPVKAEAPQRKMSIESAAESLQSASLNSPVHSPSFAYPTKLSVPAEASRIIRRHSSSSSYSSRSNSPRRPSIDTDRSPVLPQSVPSSPEKSITDADSGRSNSPKKYLLSLKKPDGTFYCDKTKQMLHAVNDSKATVNELSERAERLMDMKIKEAENQIMNKILENKDDSTNVVFKKDISNILKNNFNAEFKKSIKKNLMAAKLSKPKRTTLVGNVGLSPETQLQLLKALSKQESCAAAAVEAGSSTTSPSEPSTSVARGSTPSSPPVFRNCNAANYLKEILGDGQKKRDGEEKQRSSVRQNAGSFTYREINLRRYEHLVQIILTPISTKMKNAFNVQVFKEMTNALNCLRKDDTCRVVLLTSTGSAFCHGIDLTSLIHATPEKRKSAAVELVLSLRNFIKCLATFNKPLIAGVHGAAVGLGVTMLPFFDMVVASDKATFHTPYARLGQIPEGAATLTLPQMLGNAVTSELLFGCRKLTASEALHFGLVTRILWPDRFQEELIPLIRGIATQSSQSMEATKALLRSNLCSKLDNALLSESQILLKHWMSNECQNCFKQYLEEETPTMQK